MLQVAGGSKQKTNTDCRRRHRRRSILKTGSPPRGWPWDVAQRVERACPSRRKMGWVCTGLGPHAVRHQRTEGHCTGASSNCHVELHSRLQNAPDSCSLLRGTWKQRGLLLTRMRGQQTPALPHSPAPTSPPSPALLPGATASRGCHRHPAPTARFVEERRAARRRAPLCRLEAELCRRRWRWRWRCRPNCCRGSVPEEPEGVGAVLAHDAHRAVVPHDMPHVRDQADEDVAEAVGLAEDETAVAVGGPVGEPSAIAFSAGFAL
mmetsp:Transcript_37371/g.112791  ORF Transcript_37371/g.112791 Transcript_37371/m.112791 type:complete len:264 (-) Transcript_37371:73-864(-)